MRKLQAASFPQLAQKNPEYPGPYAFALPMDETAPASFIASVVGGHILPAATDFAHIEDAVKGLPVLRSGASVSLPGQQWLDEPPIFVRKFCVSHLTPPSLLGRSVEKLNVFIREFCG